MSAKLDTRAEIVKLAALLGVSPERLAYLESVPAGDLAALREQATDTLFDADRDRLERIAASARLVPTAIAAKVAERAFEPPLAARLAGMLDPEKAVDLARRLPPEFLADVGAVLDPRRARDVLSRLPADRVLAVARILAQRGEHVAMGRFVGHLRSESIAATLPVLDDATLLHTAFVLEGRERLDEIMGMLPEERLRSLMRAAGASGLWPEALNLLDHLSPAARGRLADLASEEDEALLAGVIEVAHDQGLWDSLLPVARSMSPAARRRFAAVGAFHRADVLEAVVHAAAAERLWPELLPLVPLLPDEARRHVAATSAALDRELQAEVIATAQRDQLWVGLVVLAGAMGDDAPWDVAELIADLGEEELDGFLKSVAEADLWADVLAIGARIPAEQVSRMARIASRLELDPLVGRVLVAADETGLWAEGLGLLACLDAEAHAALAKPAAALAPRLRKRVVAEARRLGLLERLGPLGIALERGDAAVGRSAG
jgi:hypothetical protein